MEIHVGDSVQIKDGAIDVTNGNKAIAGKYYGEGGPLRATISQIIPNCKVYNKNGKVSTVTKVRCVGANNVVVWQVQPQDIASNIIQSSDPGLVHKADVDNSEYFINQNKTSDGAIYDLNIDTESYQDTEVLENKDKLSHTVKNGGFVPGSDWTSGKDILNKTTDKSVDTLDIVASIGPVTELGVPEQVVFTEPTVKFDPNNPNTRWRDLTEDEKKSIGAGVKIDGTIVTSVQQTAYQNPKKRREILGEDWENIQNGYGFPVMIAPAKGLLNAKYDYRIIPGDTRYQNNESLEDKLKQARATLGIPVHGNHNIAKAMKYYMYNRFKTPDTNMAHNRTVTHVFFTRPDLNLLTYAGDGRVGTANAQVKNHTDAAMLWRRNPELFKLLTDSSRCGDSDNFNMLLSNNVASFEIADDTLEVSEVGKSWNDHTIAYGETGKGKLGGEFTCELIETDDLSIINLLTLWITYIDNVSRGAWKPSYNLKGDSNVKADDIFASHVYTKTLDYAASAYVFKCGPDGSDVLYWTKYYGVFPTNNGASALSWNLGTPISELGKLNIKFRYMFKKPMSPISLIEFNNICGITGNGGATAENIWNDNLNMCTRPYGGPPFIEFEYGDIKDPLRNKGVNFARKDTHIRLRTRPTADSALTDDLLYRPTYTSSKNKQADTGGLPKLTTGNIIRTTQFVGM